jgi:hypothetical protein
MVFALHFFIPPRSILWQKYSLKTTVIAALFPSPSLYAHPFITAPRFSQTFLLWGLRIASGFAFIRRASFKPSWPLALSQQASPAIVVVALACFWTSGLTLQSSGLAFGQPLTWPLA